jgi:hypothetical protein
MSEELTPDHFKPHLHKSFRVKDGRHSFTLAAIEQRRREAWELETGLREPFNLIFRGPPGDVLPEGLYTVAAEDGPEFELYLIPVHTPARDRQNYQASFS